MKVQSLKAFAVLLCLPLLPGSATLLAQTAAVTRPTPLAATAPTAVPALIPFSGIAPVATGKLAQETPVTFLIFKEETGGEPLWTETQNVTIDAAGHYQVQLGASSPTGLPSATFATGEGRWLEVQIAGQQPAPRILLSSVPYAMKSADAQSLAGHSAGEFVTQDQLAALALQSGQASGSLSPDVTPLTVGPVTGQGTANTVPLWTGANTQANSVITESGADIGIGEATPAATLDINGTELVRGTFAMAPEATATTASGYQSQSMQLQSSAWSTTTNGPVTENFNWTLYPTGNNTATPGANLIFRYQYGNNAETPLFQVSSNGIMTFSPGQTFPGTVAAVTATTPVTYVNTAGTVNIGLNLPQLENSLSAYFSRLGASNTFVGNQFITGGGVTASGGLNAASSTITGLITSAGGFLSNSTVNLNPTTTSTATAGVNSPILKFGASSFNSSSSTSINQTFAWQAQSVGNDTTAPSSDLALLYASGVSAPSNTGLSISPNGNINFVANQVFPIKGTGGGTITGITTSSPLTGSGTAGSVALGLNEATLASDITPTLETTYDARYALLSGNNTFTGTYNWFNGYVEGHEAAGTGNAALLGWGSNGSVGTFGDSDTAEGIEGESSSGQGVWGVVTAPVGYAGGATNGPEASAGVTGSTGSTFSAEYTNEAPVAYAGVWADTSGSGASGIPIALFATADTGYGFASINNSSTNPSAYVYNSAGSALLVQANSDYGISASSTTGSGIVGTIETPANGGAGVYGISSLNSGVSADYNIFGGVWGDTGSSVGSVAPAWPVGVIGTADDSYAGVFLNNSTNASTLYIENYASGGATGLFKTFMATSSEGTCGIGGGSMSCTGPIKSLATTSSARTVETYAVQSPESWMEDFGSAQLRNGVAVVSIEPAFGETISADASYHVFLTPNGDSKGLYVIAKTANSFEVRESGGGTSTLSFDYRIVAKRRGYESARLVDVTEPFARETKVASLIRSAKPRVKAAHTLSPLATAAKEHRRPLPLGRMPVDTKPVSHTALTTKH